MPPVDKETFSYWVTHPGDLTSADFQQLQESLTVYPYCQSLYTLTAKAASLHQRGQTIPYVRRAAAHALSRNALRKLIDNEFEWSDNLLLKLNELASRQVPIPDDYRHESYALYRDKMGTGSIQFPLLQLPRLIFGDASVLDQSPLRPPIDDPTVAEEAIQADLALDKQQGATEETPEVSLREVGDRQKVQLEIIENFIRNEPRIAPVRGKLVDSAEQEDLAQRSQAAVPTGTLVTESFAKILARQGKYDKAIDIYEKLTLKNPEKSAYFAAKISELQGDLKES
jgi:tetratricopeptide (TPR) repeat protein